jgi:hypothetical protein
VIGVEYVEKADCHTIVRCKDRTTRARRKSR